MARFPFLLLLGLRGPAHGVLGLAGGVGMLAGIVLLYLGLSDWDLGYLVWSALCFGVWYGSIAARWGYDSMVLNRTPEGYSLHLF